MPLNWKLQPPPSRVAIPIRGISTGTSKQRNQNRCMLAPPGPAPVGKVHPEAVAGASPQDNRRHQCPTCKESFKTSRGLGVHKAAKHRPVRDAEQRDNIKKARWDPEEKRLLAEHGPTQASENQPGPPPDQDQDTDAEPPTRWGLQQSSVM